MIDADPKLAVVIQPAKYLTQACVPPSSDLQRTPQGSASFSSRTGRLPTEPHASASGDYSNQTKSNMVKTDSTPFQLDQKVKPPCYSVKPEKKWKASQHLEELHCEYRASVMDLTKL